MQNQKKITGTYNTENASKYLQQLCKHFAHKVEVEYDETQGKVHFPFGPLMLTAQNNLLTAQFSLENADDAQRGKDVVDNHLARFAFRENFAHMDWQ